MRDYAVNGCYVSEDNYIGSLTDCSGDFTINIKARDEYCVRDRFEELDERISKVEKSNKYSDEIHFPESYRSNNRLGFL